MAGPSDRSYVREFTRHSNDVLMNLNELRKQHILTDVTLRVGGCPLQAHKAVLTACSGFFYSIFLGQGGRDVSVLTLPSSIEPAGFQALLDFMYTSRLLLTPGSVPAVLAAASYLQMEHVVESCHRFIQASYDRVTLFLAPAAPGFLHHRLRPPGGEEGEAAATAGFPRRMQDAAPSAGAGLPGSYCAKDKDLGPTPSPGVGGQSPPGQAASPCESSGCAPTPTAKACNWKKYRFIVLNSMQREGRQDRPEPHTQAGSDEDSEKGSPPRRLPPTPPHCSVCHQEPQELCTPSPKDVSVGRGDPCDAGEKPYRCGICGAQFNRPANLKTHLRIHSGEKPYKCETCGSRFVQVAHLRAHILIHTGEKPYPCGTCGTRFRHLQTLKSHVRIHTGEKPYHCEKCKVDFRHKSQLRLHLRQKHGAITNTKIRYQVLNRPYATLC
ncbi:hypothetical protein lerEdw1_006355 [Lerista edwardsae]|nr:hypothetical protein lerEdw1_006355 [Lerista edwardsae]